MPELHSSVLIASYERPSALRRCLDSLLRQTAPPWEVIVAWQLADTATREAVEGFAAVANFRVTAVWSPERGIVPAENAALAAATGDVILLIDDDATAPPEWIAGHLKYYADASVGAVGGPFRNFEQDASPYPGREAEPVGVWTWYGKLIGNHFDHPPSWRTRPPIACDHLAGGNMSLRRPAFSKFESALRGYWQMFEAEACCQVKSRGFRVMFDYSLVIDHWPTNRAFDGDRLGDLETKVFHPAFNHAFVASRYSDGFLRLVRLVYLLGAGSANAPGIAGYFFAVRRFGCPAREFGIMLRCLRAYWEGWRSGSVRRSRDSSAPRSEAMALNR